MSWEIEDRCTGINVGTASLFNILTAVALKPRCAGSTAVHKREFLYIETTASRHQQYCRLSRNSQIITTAPGQPRTR
eukprot:9467457-Pyramimonas_sp.AAC.1